MEVCFLNSVAPSFQQEQEEQDE